MSKRFALLALAVVSFTLPLAAGNGALSIGKPDDLGFSPERLARVREAVQRHVDAGQVSGAVTLVARRGKIAQFESYGVMDLESKKPMPKDGIFRLASMSKPITAVAVMMMVEEGKVRLTDPVSRFIPEFRGQRVAVPKPGTTAPPPLPPGAAPTGPKPESDFAPATREITVRDLLTHTSGLG
ncbi:MAG TPA: serine hydrolase domain-containing protein, partial [Vicinamibacterales bacterium]|nr:serine hydrolase domain-containing protein [Vicinamibacterales bacterium]